jgi:hypothetical protein
MKQKYKNHTSHQAQNAKAASSHDQPKHQVYDFFALLMKIDKRNNPKNYEHQKSRNSADQAS